MCYLAVFLDVAQAFDKVRHTGLYKLKATIPSPHHLIFESSIMTYSTCHEVLSGVPLGNVLGPLLYLIFTADLPTTDHTTIASFVDDTGLIATHSDPIVASHYLQLHLDLLHAWFDNWNIKINQAKSSHVTFTTTSLTCPQVAMNNVPIPMRPTVKYIGLYLDQRPNWSTHIKTKRLHINLKLRSMNWLLGRKSQLALANKLL